MFTLKRASNVVRTSCIFLARPVLFEPAWALREIHTSCVLVFRGGLASLVGWSESLTRYMQAFSNMSSNLSMSMWSTFKPIEF